MRKLREKLASPDIDDLPPIPLNELADDLGAIADELRVVYELDGFARLLDDVAERLLDGEELTKRKERLDETWPVNSETGEPLPRSADQLIKHARRDRRHQEDMKLILRAGGTTYRGQKFLGGKDDPYINRFTRQEVIAEFKVDWRNQLGRKSEEREEPANEKKTENETMAELFPALERTKETKALARKASPLNAAFRREQEANPQS